MWIINVIKRVNGQHVSAGHFPVICSIVKRATKAVRNIINVVDNEATSCDEIRA